MLHQHASASPMNELAQAASAYILSRTTGEAAAWIAAKRYGRNALSTRALEATLGSEGGFLIPSELSSQVIDALRSVAVFRRHVTPANVLPMIHGNLTLGRADSSVTVGWIGEGAVVDASQPSFGDVSLSSKKVHVDVPVSNSLLRYGPEVERFVESQLLKSFASAEDGAFLINPGSQYSPKGVRWLANAVNDAVLDYSVTTVISDLKSTIAALEDANIKMLAPVWYTSPKVKRYLETAVDSVGAFQFPSVAEGRLIGFPIESTTSVPTNLGESTNQSEIYLVDMAEVLIGQAFLELGIHGDANYHDSNGNLVSAYDRDELVIRMIAGVDMGLRHSQAAAVLTAVPWGN